MTGNGPSGPGLEAALQEALAERERLNVVITYLSEKLGRSVPEASGSDVSGLSHPPAATPKVDVETGRVDPLSLVSEGEFYGQSGPAAAAAVLRKVGKPRALKTEQLVRAVRKGGVPVKTGSTLYRSLVRSSKFKRVGKGLWGLSEWYPAGQARTSSREGEDHLTEAEPDMTAESEERPDT